MFKTQRFGSIFKQSDKQSLKLTPFTFYGSMDKKKSTNPEDEFSLTNYSPNKAYHLVKNNIESSSNIDKYYQVIQNNIS
jgi:hypothetical protein